MSLQELATNEWQPVKSFKDATKVVRGSHVAIFVHRRAAPFASPRHAFDSTATAGQCEAWSLHSDWPDCMNRLAARKGATPSTCCLKPGIIQN